MLTSVNGQVDAYVDVSHGLGIALALTLRHKVSKENKFRDTRGRREIDVEIT